MASRSVSARYIVIGNEGYLLSELLGETLCNGSKALTLIGAVLYLAQVRAKDNLCAVIQKLVDGRKSCNDTGLVGDNAVLERNVEIAANQYSLACCIKIVNGFLV